MHSQLRPPAVGGPVRQCGQQRMTRLPSAAAHHGVQVSLPAAVEELLVDVVADGFALYCCGLKAAPNALVASYGWEHHVDLLTVQNFDRINAARVPKRGRLDIFVPEVVVWSYEGPPQPTLRALLELRRKAGSAVLHQHCR